jgi:hypothetical protein
VDQNLALFVFAQLATAGGIYAAIRADLREALTRVAMAEKRLDRLEAPRA